MHALPLLTLLTSAAALPQQHPLSSISNLIPSLHSDTELCPLAPKVSPPNDGLHDSLHFLHDAQVRETQARRLSRAVQVPTTVSDFMTDPYDEGFEVFVRFQELLAEMFPLVHSRAKLEHINRLGLLYTLPGKRHPNSNKEDKKPLLFMAHQDVVPIANAEDWTYPPFSGHYDAESGYIWGRGSSDCKNTLIGLLSVLEDLLSQSFSPSRDIIFAFGFDEESHGFLGAGSLAPFLSTRYNASGGVEFILDEGGMGLQPLGEDTIYALPGVGEKGAIDLRIDLNVTGGHSSIPPPHTGIGVMSQIIYALEREQLFVPYLGSDHPTRRTLECQARYSADSVEPWLTEVLESDDYVRAAEEVAASRGEMQGVVFRTSQAADMISGGVKVNALPEKVSAVVNYRVALHELPSDVFERAEGIISRIAEEHGLSFSSSMSVAPNAEGYGEESQNHISLAPLTDPLRPAPVSPTSLDSKTWAKFTGVTRAVFEAVFNKTVVVSGDVMTGNTDTRFYWDLSENIYRWSPAVEGGAVNIHTVDERVQLDSHLHGMMIYYDLIRSFDA